MEEIKKHIDETWKETVDKERKDSKGEKEAIPTEATFSFFISTLALQASIFLGLIPNPATNKKEKNMAQAKFIIDNLSMFKDKTKNNLDEEENKLLENILYELRTQYVAANKEVK